MPIKLVLWRSCDRDAFTIWYIAFDWDLVYTLTQLEQRTNLNIRRSPCLCLGHWVSVSVRVSGQESVAQSQTQLPAPSSSHNCGPCADCRLIAVYMRLLCTPSVDLGPALGAARDSFLSETQQLGGCAGAGWLHKFVDLSAPCKDCTTTTTAVTAATAVTTTTSSGLLTAAVGLTGWRAWPADQSLGSVGAWIYGTASHNFAGARNKLPRK